MDLKQEMIVLFDGVCNLCNYSVQFIIQYDSKKQFLFTSLQSDASKEILLQTNEKNTDLSSIIFIKKGVVYKESTAVLEICRYLENGYPLLYIFIVIPPFIRNTIYKYIAKNRYKWFGKKDNCMILSKELQDRFL